MLHCHVPIDLVVAIPLLCIITCPNRKSADVEFMFTFRVKKGMKYFTPLFIIQVG
ncbi:hypothetical protein D3C75_1304470 [compost metagenome]